MNEKLPPGVCCHPWYNATSKGTYTKGYICTINQLAPTNICAINGYISSGM